MHNEIYNTIIKETRMYEKNVENLNWYNKDLIFAYQNLSKDMTKIEFIKF